MGSETVSCMADWLICVTQHKRPLPALQTHSCFSSRIAHHTHLLTVADALLFEAQLSFQVLDDGVLGSLDVGVGGDARRPAGQRLLGKGFAEARTKQKSLSRLKLFRHKRCVTKGYLSMLQTLFPLEHPQGL